MMKTKITGVILIAILATPLYAAETYRLETSINYGIRTTDSNIDTKGFTVAGTYYLKPIAIDNSQPFLELDFLQKASSLTLNYSDINTESATISKTTLNPLGIIGNFYLEDFVVGFSHTNSNAPLGLKSDPTLKYELKSTSTGIKIGYRVVPSTIISLNHEQYDASYARNSNLLTPIADLKISTNGIRSYTVTSLNKGQSLVFDLEYKQIKREQNKNESNDEYSAKLRFYPQTNYFIEGGYRLNNGDVASDKGNTFELGAGYSFTPRLGVIFSTSQFNGDVSAEKSSSRTSSLTVGYRF
jgi:hypothetical protein